MDKDINKDTVLIETTIHAPIEKVWAAWTDQNIIQHWFGSDPNGEVLHAKLDVRPGGSFEVTFKDPDQTEHTCYGVYHEVKQLNRLTFTWHWKSEPGVESFIVFEHRNVGTGSTHDYIKGWQSTFLKLERLIGRNA